MDFNISIKTCLFLLISLIPYFQVQCRSFAEMRTKEDQDNGGMKFIYDDKWIPMRVQKSSDVVAQPMQHFAITAQPPSNGATTIGEQMKTAESSVRPTRNEAQANFKRPPIRQFEDEKKQQQYRSLSENESTTKCAQAAQQLKSTLQQQQQQPHQASSQRAQLEPIVASSSAPSSTRAQAENKRRQRRDEDEAEATSAGPRVHKDEMTSNEDTEEEDDEADESSPKTKATGSREMMNGNESISFESAVAPPTKRDSRRANYDVAPLRETDSMMHEPEPLEDNLEGGAEQDSDEYDQQQPQSPQLAEGVQQQQAEEANRNELEAAEASEADAANRSALDEQQQQQREIILAQAQSEAKAIKEQQEALMRQQTLQQQMLMKRARQFDLVGNQSDSHQVGSLANRDNLQRQRQRQRPHQRQFARRTNLGSEQQIDSQFSDLSGGGKRQPQQQQQQQSADGQLDEEQYGEQLGSDSYSTAEAVAAVEHLAASPDAIGYVNEKEKESLRAAHTDLIPAAQHHYGAHYDTLHGHQDKYYQFAESHKKGQFDSGFKRGGKKFKISGHSSQHKSHAEGHVKWQAKKGKGNQYWNYKHEEKKHHDHHF